ncbi:Hypothetical Protein FCC1311_070052 [Hondaea fermentalgiana]|uniref:Zn(2)-C6 fungal-type domain-containing protein n=1 Tax=Hondaea fermentalgiana TaxID=2315210 RepID=A0A2R5GJI5_9STRA|nr:Hypothetical Protein FCC1311_070052 [Hondaea fermentalgiana]|eukprot:GBG30785.1 Hypothetical Protein FCC1311_070052 [Hondaea fermentalgiana]
MMQGASFKSPFKAACEACTKAKCKCNGKRPCLRCEKKNLVCVYAFKRRRGPPKNRALMRSDEPLAAPGTQSKLKLNAKHKTDGETDRVASVTVDISPYERRLWTVFFTIFRHQENSFVDNEKRGIAWCWFARQLQLLRWHCKRTHNKQLSKMIESFLEAMNVKMKSVLEAVKDECPVKPSCCAECSTTIMMHPHKEPSFPVNEQAAQGTTELLKAEQESLAAVPPSKRFLDMLDAHKNNTKASLEFLQYDYPAEYDIRSNEAFARMFNLSDKALRDLITWSGSGFLPWGGDIIAKIIVTEEDLVTFLQIMSLKFQSMGMKLEPEPGYVREVPSTHSFKFWVFSESEGLWRQRQCLLECCHRVYKKGKHIESHIIFNFDNLGEPVDEDSKETEPISTETLGANQDNGSPGGAAKGGETQQDEGESSQTSKTHPVASPSAVSVPPVPRAASFTCSVPPDVVPSDLASYYQHWDIFEPGAAVAVPSSSGDGQAPIKREAGDIEKSGNGSGSGSDSPQHKKYKYTPAGMRKLGQAAKGAIEGSISSYPSANQSGKQSQQDMLSQQAEEAARDTAAPSYGDEADYVDSLNDTDWLGSLINWQGFSGGYSQQDQQ